MFGAMVPRGTEESLLLYELLCRVSYDMYTRTSGTTKVRVESTAVILPGTAAAAVLVVPGLDYRCIRYLEQVLHGKYNPGYDSS